MTIEIKNVSVSYGERPALLSVSLSIPNSEWLAPIGPNGAGKSTLLRAIAGLLPHEGEIRIDGVVFDRQHRRAFAQNVAFVPQRPQLPPTMTVADYIMLGRTPHISYFGTEGPHDHEVVGEVIDRLALGAFAKRQLGAISGGEAQRAVLGRALSQQAPILLLDEPTSSLDLGHQLHVLELVDELRQERGLTVISAMHDLVLASQFADRLCLLERGTVVICGSAAEVVTEERLQRHYDASADVLYQSDGSVVIVPRRTPRR